MFLETLFSWDIDYDDMAMFILNTIDTNITERMDDVKENWDGDVGALRAAVVAQVLKDIEAKDTRMARLEASALLKRYQRVYDEPLPSTSL